MTRKMTWRRISIVILSLWLLLFALELVVSFHFCNDRLVFTLDDPYIHLAVADQILSGGYGVNGYEASSPSSSIIWPYLLAFTEALHLGPSGPLLINIIAAFASVLSVLRFLEYLGFVSEQHDRLFTCIIAILAIFAISAVALPMTGLEHSLHVWATIVTYTGLVQTARGAAPRFIHFAALVLLPLIRFEGIAFAGAAIGGFVLLGQRRFAASAAIVILCSLAAYCGLMSSRGLPLLPSSVLLKSRIAEDAYEGRSAFGSMLYHLIVSLKNPYAGRLALLGLAIACGTLLLRADRKTLVVCTTALTAIAAHLAFGEYDWFHRYEVYIIALATLALLYVTAQAKPHLNTARWITLQISVVLLIAFASTPYISAALQTPLAARNIYDQQYQMSLFAQQLYKHPVAVNDLGLVAYKNPNFVLDLWGLGSEKVRKAKLAGTYGPEKMAAFADEYHVGLVMIYRDWFPKGIPASWKAVAILHTDRVTAAVGDVSFYRTPAADAGEVAKALDAFKTILPSRDRLEIVVPSEAS